MYSVTEQSTANPIVIIGGGMAGGNAAATLRDEGFPGPVVLISREPGVPLRPSRPLSKTLPAVRRGSGTAGTSGRSGWCADHDVELRSGAVVASVDPAAHTIALASGEELAYQKVSDRHRRAQTGSSGSPAPACPESTTSGPKRNATRSSKRRFRAGARSVVGSGFIGCEGSRASLTQLGVQVTLVFPRRGSAGKGSWAVRVGRA